ncbi:AAA family ATPase [Blautia wexlerae]|uniref:AAA family ATPase n=2 Tax=Blautia wexlerae TaxID=418240 RepID=UPI0034A1A1ED
MNQVISIGKQDFSSLRENNCFYIDKSDLIREWWDSQDEITLITRPRRFGKTLNMSMLNYFFSNLYTDKKALFEDLSIWKEEKYRNLQGIYPVIFISFASVKGNTYQDTRDGVIMAINEAYSEHRYLLEWKGLTEGERKCFEELDNYAKNPGIKEPVANDTICNAVKNLSNCLYRYYKKKILIFLDEYDTPMQESYLYEYWKEFIAFIRNFFNATFKTNPYLERAMMTGITRVSKESVFSDLNNLNVVTTTSREYETCFGFTEQEVFCALETMGMSEEKQLVKSWYDGFVFGSRKDIYNPWSITNYLDKKQLRPYWADTSSNGLINRLIRRSSPEIKELMEELLQGREIVVNFDEQIVFEQLEQDENAIWSLMLASGYLKATEVEYRGILRDPWYHLRITNLETTAMFSSLFKGWFYQSRSNYNQFVKALLNSDLDAMNYYMNQISMATFSYFDMSGKEDGSGAPERFYHGFVLGLIADQTDQYEICSNRESGFGRYDVMMIPRKPGNRRCPAIIMEFKVHNSKKEETLEETVDHALDQIEAMNYDAQLFARGFERREIRHYGFAFEGKKVLIGMRE